MLTLSLFLYLVAEMLLAILSICSEEELEQSSSDESTDVDSDGAEARTVADQDPTPNDIAQRRQLIKDKILDVGRMQRMFTILRCAPHLIYIYIYIVNHLSTHGVCTPLQTRSGERDRVDTYWRDVRWGR
jgi:hypothetical protein